MSIVFKEFRRDGNDIVGIDESGKEFPLSWEYILAYKPQIGDTMVEEAKEPEEVKPRKKK